MPFIFSSFQNGAYARPIILSAFYLIRMESILAIGLSSDLHRETPMEIISRSLADITRFKVRLFDPCNIKSPKCLKLRKHHAISIFTPCY